jgi:hypothetical protein
MVIVKTKKGYIIKSESGKNLSRLLKSMSEAKRRLAQIEYFKNK